MPYSFELFEGIISNLRLKRQWANARPRRSSIPPRPPKRDFSAGLLVLLFINKVSYFVGLRYNGLPERRLPCLDAARIRLSCLPRRDPISKPYLADIRHRIAMSSGPRSSSWQRMDGRTKPLPSALIRPGVSYASGGNATWKKAWQG